jgi:hypothetical protein
MTPLVWCAPQRVLNRDIVNHCDVEHPGFPIIKAMTHYYPRAMTRDALRTLSDTDGWEPRFSASFEWLLLRINDTLPLVGWEVWYDGKYYHLRTIGKEHHERLLRKQRMTA